jgi:hypothetical protein
MLLIYILPCELALLSLGWSVSHCLLGRAVKVVIIIIHCYISFHLFGYLCNCIVDTGLSWTMITSSLATILMVIEMYRSRPSDYFSTFLPLKL